MALVGNVHEILQYQRRTRTRARGKHVVEAALVAERVAELLSLLMVRSSATCCGTCRHPLRVRQMRSKPLMADFDRWPTAHAPPVLPKSPLVDGRLRRVLEIRPPRALDRQAKGKTGRSPRRSGAGGPSISRRALGRCSS
jgi:hypothetical protein